MSAELQLYDRMQDPIAAVDRMGEWLAKSGMFGCERIEQGKVLALACMAERKSPVQIAREYYLIDGRLSDRTDSMLAKFRGKGGKHKILARTAEEAAVELTLEGQTFVSRVTFAELAKEPFVYARDGKTWKKNYATPRARMQSLWARAMSDGVRTLAPEIVAGILTPQEIEDESGGSQTVPADAILDLSKAKGTDGTDERKALPEGTGPIITPAPQAPAASTLVEAPAPNGTLSLELSREVHQVVDPHAQLAFAWLIREKHLKPGQGIEYLSELMARKIVKQADSFIRAIQPATHVK
jgi:hypothetical protein